MGDGDERGWDGATPRLSRLRRALLGDDSPRTDAEEFVARPTAAPSVLSPIWTTPFDEPPPEPVQLDTDALPWELAGDGEERRDEERRLGEHDGDLG